MNKLLLIITTTVLLSCFAKLTHAQTTTVNTAASAVIITPIAVTQVTPMHFGVISVDENYSGTCIITTEGMRIATDGVSLSSLAPSFSLATYKVSGEPMYTYSITLPSEITIRHSDNLSSMYIDNLLAKSFSGTESHRATGTLNSETGTESFSVGGTLHIVSGQIPGQYSGDFDITVVYN